MLDELRGRAEAGEAEAAATLAALRAIGIGAPPSWDAAFDWLVTAAEHGSQAARGQLRILSRDSALRAEPAAPELWRRLRAGFDVVALTAPPPRESLSDQPRIRLFRAFATAEECDWAMAVAGPRLQPAQIWDPETGVGRSDPNRTNSALDLKPAEMDVVLQILRARISAASNLPLPVFEAPQIMRYAVGEEFRPHYDFLDPAVPGYDRELALFGQRIATCLIYLNDDFEGGETVFPKAGLSHRAHKGDALLFANIDASRAPDPLTLHAGLPTTRGEKWIFSQWIRDRSRGAPAG
jgi:predicted 2-oxoglutarate/Fe(II)-dependent dioxygenase YbiX